ncbi:uncharacterized protein LOC144717061 [Wolffia australiana]
MLQGSLDDHYHLLPSYVAELRKVNENNTFKLLLDTNTPDSQVRFKRLYICFESLARGFLEGCRKFIGLDGCFLKSEVKGQLLSAVGKDGNNQMFPIAWAVVEGENEDSWTWFIELLMQDLGIFDGIDWTFMSDQQKGLGNAMAKLLPNAEHRNCARHIFANWKKGGHSIELLKNIFWRTMRSIKPEAARDFEAVGVHKFCMAFISEWPECETIDNNICECFNSYILPYRGKRIIDMLEDIKSACMKRIVRKRDLFSNSSDQLCLRIRGLLEENRLKSRKYRLKHAGHYQFEAMIFGDGYVVDLRAQKCSCRYWGLRGIPCPHAIACIHWIKDDPKNFVSNRYKRDMYQRAYHMGIPPMNMRNMWDEDEVNYVFPPLVKRQPGRPKIKRRVDMVERFYPNHQGFTNKGAQKQCSLCLEFGHNRKTCARRCNQATDMGRKKQVEQITDVQVQRGKSPEQPVYGAITEASGPMYTCTSAVPRRTSYLGSYGGQFVTIERGGRESQEQFIISPGMSSSTTDKSDKLV